MWWVSTFGESMGGRKEVLVKSIASEQQVGPWMFLSDHMQCLDLR